jgi:hypothetical protein
MPYAVEMLAAERRQDQPRCGELLKAAPGQRLGGRPRSSRGLCPVGQA